MLVLAIVVLIPTFSGREFAIAAAFFPFIVLMIAVTYCVTGYLIGQRRARSRQCVCSGNEG